MIKKEDILEFEYVINLKKVTRDDVERIKRLINLYINPRVKSICGKCFQQLKQYQTIIKNFYEKNKDFIEVDELVVYGPETKYGTAVCVNCGEEFVKVTANNKICKSCK